MSLSEKRRRSIRLPLPRVREAIVSRFVAGDALYTLAWDYGITPDELEGCLREALKSKAAKNRRSRS